jgi:Kelch motif/Galactose oxidase, central domain
MLPAASAVLRDSTKHGSFGEAATACLLVPGRELFGRRVSAKGSQKMNLHSYLKIRAWFSSASLVSTALLVCLLATATTVQAQQPGVWSVTASLGSGRYAHTSTLLANGKVLVVGGSRQVVGTTNWVTTDFADLYDPVTGRWSPTGSLNTPRSDHIAVRLDNGKVLVAGGERELLGTILSSAEIYDPDTGIWSATGNLSVARASHKATLLADGKVLVTGGGSGKDYWAGLDTAELYDPFTGTWRPTGTMNSPRSLHTATLLPDGRVLVVGGIHRGTASYYEFVRVTEIYDPATGRWTAIGNPITARVLHTATLLDNGKVLVAGGVRIEPFDHYGDGVEKAELYDPATGQWSATGNQSTPRVLQTATLLPNGRVLAAGGYSDYNTVSSAELYDPVTASWSVTGSLNAVHSEHTATLLASGKVLVAGGGGNNSEELYDPGFEIPLLTLNSTTYCIGDPWSLMVIHSAPSASVQLLGVSNRASWTIARWGVTDQDGRFITGGTIADGTEGTHSLRVEINGIRSTSFSFAVSKCRP